MDQEAALRIIVNYANLILEDVEELGQWDDVWPDMVHVLEDSGVELPSDPFLWKGTVLEVDPDEPIYAYVVSQNG